MPAVSNQSRHIPEHARGYGFALDPVGAHIGKTMMLAELRALFAGTNAGDAPETMRHLVRTENILLKATDETRKSVLQVLRTLYALDPAVPLYRLLRALWDVSEQDQPLLAALAAVARDPLLRSTVPWLTEVPDGTVVNWPDFATILERAFPGRYAAASIKTTAQNIASTWTQAGILRGKLHKTRAQPAVGPAAATLALLLGYLCGLRGDALFGSLWARLIVRDSATLHRLAQEAARTGLLDYRRIDDVIEVRFDRLMASTGVSDGAG